MKGSIRITGARENNLQNIDVEIPWHKITVLTGLSGSGKSTLALDTLYAEGLRRYVECLSTYARQFFERVSRPDMDDISGLPPVVAIESRNHVKNSRSTVGTTTEVYDYLRLFFAKIGKVYCPECGEEVKPSSPESAASELIRKYPSRRAVISFPVDTHAVVPETLLSSGFTRVLRKGKPRDIEEIKRLSKGDEVVVDRLVLESGRRSRITESLETAFADSRTVIVHLIEKPGGEDANEGEGQAEQIAFSREFGCPRHPDVRFVEPSPLLFSFNSPQGACKECNGFGNILDIDPDLVVPNPTLSLNEGAIEPFTKPSLQGAMKRLLLFAEEREIDADLPYEELPAWAKDAVLYGEGRFWGVRGVFKRLEQRKKHKVQVRVLISRYRSPFNCPSCNGGRLRPEALWIRVAGRDIRGLSEMPISALSELFESVALTPHEEEIAKELLRQIRSRLGFLMKMGLGYLTMHRLTRTLSGGEAQRVNLACQLGASLTETLYIMDEPSIGLHPRDVSRLVSIIGELKEKDNTVLIVEHDFDIIRSTDYIIELGPLAGENGGRVVYQGAFEGFLENSAGSITKLYMAGEDKIPVPEKRREGSGKTLAVLGVEANNLKHIDVEIPLGTLTCITGVSGSGKSTLVNDVLYSALVRRRLQGTSEGGRVQRGQIQGGERSAYREITGAEHLSEVVMLDQTPIGRSSRSNPVTYIKAYDEIRKAFAATWEARSKGLTPGSFSFNVPGGRCEACQGEGLQKIEMYFLADVVIECDQCGGKRFKKEVLGVRYKDKNIDEVLQLTVSEALFFFRETPALMRRLQILNEVGLGYLRLGQPAPTLSGGEAQRIKIARELGRRGGRGSRGSKGDKSSAGGILYILDEPTVGLHIDDVKNLLRVLNKLVDGGNTAIVIEHNLEVIKSCDYVIDLGPEGGDEGGYVVAKGTPEAVARAKASHTGRYLKSVL